ncbi:conjugative transposon protein TraM [Algoriphagus pacificus]|uniref:Conjugative transposon protein TraM n=1 Tax=Algoriphagus pacificus TaxID=2811234 RepID=A0ABS3CL38_9BACT|nr:conjugative transposon protein TraM [Algoriphagus pacificus]MBN7817470.1 conjugative transposon protein TraM [Algoriphagus pacificus]
MKVNTEKQMKERKFLMVLPLLTFPFLCLAFWALGGGKGSGTETGIEVSGLNLELPSPDINETSLDKLESYQQADLREKELKEQLRLDPFADYDEKRSDAFLSDTLKSGNLLETEIALQEKLESFQQLIQESTVEPVSPSEEIPEFEPKVNAGEIQQLEALMNSLNASDQVDPEMQQIDKMLEKLLDVQHPQRVHERMEASELAAKENVYAVSLEPIKTLPKMHSNPNVQSVNRFYGLEEKRVLDVPDIPPGIPARVTRDQEVVSGATLEMEFKEPVYVAGKSFPKGTLVTGICTLQGDRLKIEISAIRSGNFILPVSLTAMDLDAIEGIRVPDTITRDAVKEGTSGGIQSMGQLSLASSWEAQASMSGMETLKGILSKKARLVKVTVKAGHPLLLVDQSNH